MSTAGQAGGGSGAGEQPADLTAAKRHEARLRREAAQLGLALRKSRARNPMRMDYGRYKLMNLRGNYCMAGGFPYGHSLSLEDVEDIIDEVLASRDQEELNQAWAAAHQSAGAFDAKNRR